MANTAILLKKPKDASKALKAFRDAAAGASTWDQQIGAPQPGTQTFTATALSFPTIGEGTLAVRLSSKFRDAEFGNELDTGTSDYVVWRRGPIISVVVAANLDTLTYAKKADAKVAKALRPCPKKKRK